MNKEFSVMLAMIFCALVAQAQDTPVSSSGIADPDYTREAEFHRIYKTYNEQPTSEEIWEKAVGPRKAEVYKVQKGDTLSGISTTFFGDQFFWPKVWSINSGSILNPHEISPGMNVQFYPGSIDEAPTLNVAENKAESATEEKIINTTEENKEPVVKKESTRFELPPPKYRTPLLKNLPASLPNARVGAEPAAPVKLEVVLQPTKFPPRLEYLEYFLDDKPVVGVGKVVGTEVDSKMAGNYQHIFVELPEQSDKEYMVQKNISPLKESKLQTREGYMVEIQGEIEILEKVNDKKNIYRALVTKSLEPIEVGSLLVPGKLPMVDPTGKDSGSGPGGRIIGGQFDKKRTLFGSNVIVFLDAGANQGVQVGQVLPIYADEKAKVKNSEVETNFRTVGAAKIVRVSDNFATAYVVKSRDNIEIGDIVGTPSVSAAATEAPPVETSKAPQKSDQDDFEKEFDAEPSAAPSTQPQDKPDSGIDDTELEL